MKKSCRKIEVMLVDYADGQLSSSGSSEVKEHLAQCEACRKVLEALHRSLDLAGVIWTDGLTEAENMNIPSSRKARRLSRFHYAAIAASILLVITASVVWRALVKPVEVQEEPSFAAIEREIMDEGTAAKLLTATDLLADKPNVERLVKKQYEHIVDRYPNTKAAETAKTRIQ